jgi:hypothetical protein
MKEENLENLLNELTEATAEPAPSYLAEEIKNQIPQHLSRHRGGPGTISIIIDLRIGKLAAAAAIIITMILFANFFDGRGPESGGIYESGKLLIDYFTGKADTGNIPAAKSRYELLIQSGKDAVYYGDSIDPQDKDAILIQWKVSEGEYRVVFGDLREETVNAEELIRLQAKMLRNRKK